MVRKDLVDIGSAHSLQRHPEECYHQVTGARGSLALYPSEVLGFSHSAATATPRAAWFGWVSFSGVT